MKKAINNDNTQVTWTPNRFVHFDFVPHTNPTPTQRTLHTEYPSSWSTTNHANQLWSLSMQEDEAEKKKKMKEEGWDSFVGMRMWLCSRAGTSQGGNRAGPLPMRSVWAFPQMLNDPDLERKGARSVSEYWTFISTKTEFIWFYYFEFLFFFFFYFFGEP